MRTWRPFGSIGRKLVCAGISFVAAVALQPAAGAATPPNIVVIMTDDQWYDSVAYLPKTQTLLGASGVTFTNFHVSNPLCCPSRSTYLTGQYSHNHGVESNVAPNGGFAAFDDSSTLATWLHSAGYHTTLIGKYLNGYGTGESATYVPPGWDNWRAAIGGTTQLLYDYTLNENGSLVDYGTAPADFKTDVFADLAVANIESRAGAGPFFMSVNVTAPHNERPKDDQSVRAAPRHEGMFGAEPFPVKGNFNEANVRDKPAWIRGLPRLTAAIQTDVAQSWRDKLEGLQSVDDLVERIVNALSTEGVLTSTVVIFTSDNGFFFGEHRIEVGKEHVYEEATRVPLIVRGNAFAGGTVRNQVVANVDLAPTIAELAGVLPGLVQDGISLLPYATRPTYRSNRVILLENDPATPYAFDAIRTRRWVYSRLATGEDELYNIIDDPLQLVSRHAAAGQVARKAVLAALLDQLAECAGTTCNANYAN
jgi:N-acetylglucosamine-6-sulfatase